MSVTASAINRNRVTGVAIGVLLIAGVLAYQTMPRQLDPGFIIRAAQIVTVFPGASPERVEALVTDKVEEAVQEIPELDFVTSESRAGLSVVTVMMRDEYKVMRPIWDNLRRKVARIEPSLPDGIVGPNVNDEFGDTFGILLTISGDGFEYAELKEAADTVRDELLRLPAVAKVEIHGAQDERIFVEYSNARLSHMGLSPAALAAILESRNIIMPGGDVSLENERIVLEPTGNFVSVEELRRTVIQIPGASSVAYLGDIAQVRRGYIDPPSTRVRGNGLPALTLAVSMRAGGNLVELGERVEEVYQKLPALYPHGIEFHKAFFEPLTVEKKIGDFVGSVFQSVIVVLAVMLVTLGLRTGTVVATLIPATMVMSIFVMSVLDIWLDQISLAALIISLGLLVDNAIVMSESVLVRMGDGESRFDAAVASAKELSVPLLTSSLTTAAAFLPIFLAKSNVGEYTAPLFKVVTITLLISWGLSLTMIPALCVAFLKPRERDASKDSLGLRFYRASLAAFLRFRWLSLGLVIATFFGVMQLMAFVPKVFFPPTDRSFFVASFELPTGTPIESSQAMADEIDHFIARELSVDSGGGVVDWNTFIGGTPPRFVLSFDPKPPEPHRVTYMVNTKTYAAVEPAMAKLRAFAQENLPDAVTWVRALQNGPPVTKPIQVRLSGKDEGRLFSLVDEVSAKLASIPGTRNVNHDWGSRVKKLEVRVDEDRALRAGVTHLDVAVSLQTFLSGLQVTTYREDEDTIPVVLRSVASDRKDIDRLETLNVFSQTTGHSVPLSQVASIDLEFQPSVIKRRNRYKTVTVEAEVEEGVTSFSVVDQLRPYLEEQQSRWGVGYRYEFGGEVESSGKANKSINDKVPVGMLIIVMLLVWQFNSLRKPLIILATIPLAMMGVVLGLLVMRSYFGFMTLLGVISLAGIVINNAIVLIERIDFEQSENGLTPQEAIFEAAQRRLRPILLTTATTIASLIPLYVGGGVMFEPMAVAIMFGLALSTLLTLGVVPLLYALFYRVSFSGAKGSKAA